ncbi:MAG TPA: hypothetical protein VHQ99_01115 [Gaiellaceae bacterium]|nr:hypothetical protein [Gaiellaceae bacterium]
MTPERRYALDGLLDALGLPYDDSAWVPEAQLDEVFAMLTLSHERDADLDRHGRPLPPAEPPGARLAEIAAGLGLERRDYPGGERFLVALTHDVDLLGGGGFRTAGRKLAGAAVHRSGRRLREGLTFAVDAWAWRDPEYPIDAMLDAERARGSTCFFLARQDSPQDGYPERYRPALARALDQTREAGLEVGLHASFAARDRPGSIAEEARALGGELHGLRHHYLRSDPARLAAELRAGTPYPYRLWDPERREPGGWELPLVVMDATLSEERYLGLDADAAYEAAVAALEPVAEHGGAVAILWHPPQHHPRLSNGFDQVYRRLLAWIDERGGWAGSAAETLDRWEARRR